MSSGPVSKEALDLESPWGAYEPAGWSRFWMSVGRSLPRGWGRIALLIRRLARWRLSGPVDTVLWHHKLRLSARGGVSEGRILFLSQFWDDEERRAMAEEIEAGFVFVDVGANVGGYSFWVASLAGPQGRILAIEPDPELAAQLSFNIQANDAGDQILLRQVAVAVEPGEGQLILHPLNPGQNRLARPRDGELGARVSVPVRRLSHVLNEAGLGRIDGLKIDVEGGEQEILESLFRDMPVADWPRLLVVEVKPESEASPIRWLERKGYRLVVRTRLNGVFRFRGPSGVD